MTKLKKKLSVLTAYQTDYFFPFDYYIKDIFSVYQIINLLHISRSQFNIFLYKRLFYMIYDVSIQFHIYLTICCVPLELWYLE